METKLKNIAEIYTGFTQRPLEKPAVTFDVKAIQIKDLSKDQVVISENQWSELEWAYDSRPQYLKYNSIIVVARGEPKAYVFKGNESDQVVVSNQFIVVNLKVDGLKPEFLAWYFNHSQAMRTHFEMNSRGSLLMMLSISTLKEAEIVIPSIFQQDEILRLAEEAHNEALIFKQLTALRAEYNQAKSEQILVQAKVAQ